MEKLMRLDERLTKEGFSRTLSQSLIKEACVLVEKNGNWTVEKKNSFKIKKEQKIKLKPHPLSYLVSRGGWKLEEAFKKFSFPVSGLRVLDVGLSRGGFSEFWLKKGAKEVIGIDVGKNQVHPKLEKDERFYFFEQTDIKKIKENKEALELFKEKFDLISVDVSFSPLSSVISYCTSYLKQKGKLICLVKPQFEGPEFNDMILENKIRKLMNLNKLEVKDYLLSPIPGKSGQKEFFVYAYKNTSF